MKYLKSKGFTLIELLVVITIIGILAAFIVATFTSAQQQSRDARRKADLDALKKALELYKSNTAGSKYFPAHVSILAAGSCPAATIVDDTAIVTSPNTFIKKRPQDPKSSCNYLYTSAPTSCSSTCSDYRLRAVLENTNDPQIAGTQARCVLTGTDFATLIGLTYPAGTYVVCPD